MNKPKPQSADIDSLKGILKAAPDEKPVTQRLLEEHAEEIRKDQARTPKAKKYQITFNFTRK